MMDVYNTKPEQEISHEASCNNHYKEIQTPSYEHIEQLSKEHSYIAEQGGCH